MDPEEMSWDEDGLEQMIMYLETQVERYAYLLTICEGIRDWKKGPQ